MNRRGFMQAILAAAVAPTVAHAASLMPVKALESGVLIYEEGVWTPTLSFTTSGGTVAYGVSGVYQRIGDIVHINGFIDSKPASCLARVADSRLVLVGQMITAQ